LLRGDRIDQPRATQSQIQLYYHGKMGCMIHVAQIATRSTSLSAQRSRHGNHKCTIHALCIPHCDI
jgi:hypothetical protein